MLSKIKNYIEREGLNKPSRIREYNYKRIVLAKIMREDLEDTVTFEEIANIMNRTHASVINMIKNYYQLCSYKDFQALEKRVREGINFETLEEKIMRIDNMAELHWLQEELKKERDGRD